MDAQRRPLFSATVEEMNDAAETDALSAVRQSSTFEAQADASPHDRALGSSVSSLDKGATSPIVADQAPAASAIRERALSHEEEREFEVSHAMRPIVMTFVDPEVEARYVHFAYVSSSFIGGKIWFVAGYGIGLIFYVYYYGLRQGWDNGMFVSPAWIPFTINSSIAPLLFLSLFSSRLAAYREQLYLIGLVTHWPAYTIASFFGMATMWVYRFDFMLGCLFFCTFVAQARFARAVPLLLLSPLLTLILTTSFMDKYWQKPGRSHGEIILWLSVVTPTIVLVPFERIGRRAFCEMERSIIIIEKISQRLMRTEDLISCFFAKTPTLDFLSHSRTDTRPRLYRDCVLVYSDLVQFTAWSAKRSAQNVTDRIANMFLLIDLVAPDLGVEKIMTVGDAFVGAIFPSKQEAYARRCANACVFATSILHTGDPLEMRVGVACGDIIVAFVGSHPPRFDVFGETADAAQRLEQGATSSHVYATLTLVEEAAQYGHPVNAETADEGLMFDRFVEVMPTVDLRGQQQQLQQRHVQQQQQQQQQQQGRQLLAEALSDVRNQEREQRAPEMFTSMQVFNISSSLCNIAKRGFGADPNTPAPTTLRTAQRTKRRVVASALAVNEAAPHDSVDIVELEDQSCDDDAGSPTSSALCDDANNPLAADLAVAPQQRAGAADQRSPRFRQRPAEGLMAAVAAVGLANDQASAHAARNAIIARREMMAASTSLRHSAAESSNDSNQDGGPGVSASSVTSVSILQQSPSAVFAEFEDVASAAEVKFSVVWMVFDDPQNEKMYIQQIRATGLSDTATIIMCLLNFWFIVAQLVLGCIDTTQNRALVSAEIVVLVQLLVVVISPLKSRIRYLSAYVLGSLLTLNVLTHFLTVTCNTTGEKYTGALITCFMQNTVLVSQFQLHNRLTIRMAINVTLVGIGCLGLVFRQLVFKDDVLPWDPVWSIGIGGLAFVSFFSDFALRSSFSYVRRLGLIRSRTETKYHETLLSALSIMLPPFAVERLLSGTVASQALSLIDDAKEEGVDGKEAAPAAPRAEGAIEAAPAGRLRPRFITWEYEGIGVLFLSFKMGPTEPATLTDAELRGIVVSGDDDDACSLGEAQATTSSAGFERQGTTHAQPDWSPVNHIGMNETFLHVERILHDHKVHKIKSIGQTMLCVSGIENHGGVTASERSAIIVSLLKCASAIRQHFAAEHPTWTWRMGAHFGPCIGAVLGRKSLLFDVFGDSINLGSRLCTTAPPCVMQVSDAVREGCEVEPLLQARIRYREKRDIKGKGLVEVYEFDSNF